MKINVKSLVEQVVKEEISKSLGSTPVQDMSSGDTFKVALKKGNPTVEAFIKGMLSLSNNDSPYQGDAFKKSTPNHYLISFQLKTRDAKEFEESLKHKRTRDNMLDETGDEDADGTEVADQLIKVLDKAKGSSQASMIKRERGSEPGKYEPLKEARPSGVNKKYTHFALRKSDNKIVNGWEFKGWDRESVIDAVKEDIKDMDYTPKEVSVLTVQGLKNKGIDPFNWSSWQTTEGVKEAGIREDVQLDRASLQELSPATKDAAFDKAVQQADYGDIDNLVRVKRINQADTFGTQVDTGTKDAAQGLVTLFPEATKVNVTKTKDPYSSATKVKVEVIGTPPKVILTLIITKDKVEYEGPGSVNGSTAPKLIRVVQKIREKEIGLKEAVTTFVTPDGKTLDPDQKAKMKMAKPGATVVVKKAGELSEDVLAEKKDEPEDVEEVPAENPEAPAEEAPASDGSASGELGKHIADAINAAAKAIESSGDTKYEKVLGKVIKNLTAAQASLEDVQAVEAKLNEEIIKNDQRNTEKFKNSLRKAFKKTFKNPEHIESILNTYDKVAKTASKENRPVEKIAEIIVKHALNEGLVKKGDIIS